MLLAPMACRTAEIFRNAEPIIEAIVDGDKERLQMQ